MGFWLLGLLKDDGLRALRVYSKGPCTHIIYIYIYIYIGPKVLI